MSKRIFCNAVKRQISSNDCYHSKKDPDCRSCKHLKETRPEPKTLAPVSTDTKLPADFTLTTVRKDLYPNNLLWYILSVFKDKLKFHPSYRSTAEIFQAVYDDPMGGDYWRGWFDKVSLDVEQFANLLAIHAAAEYGDDNPPEKVSQDVAVWEKMIKARQDWAERPAKFDTDDVDVPFSNNFLWQKYKVIREAIILLLKEAAEMNVLPFVGDVDALLHMKAGITNQGWFYDPKESRTKSLSEIKVNPR